VSTTPPGLLESGDGRRLLAAQLFDSVGAGIGLVALPWIVLDAGGDASTAGLVAAFGGAALILVVVAGAVLLLAEETRGRSLEDIAPAV